MKILKTIALAVIFGVTASAAQAQINFSWSANAGPLNPHQTSPNQMYAQAMVYEPLVRYEKGGTLRPWLAESWEILDEGTRYRFHIRKGVKFSNGEDFNAAAVKANFEQLLKNINKHRWLEFVNQMETITVIDEHTVDLKLKSAYYPALQELSLVRPVRFMAPSAMPEEGHTGQGIKAPIGTGPWMLKESVLGVKDVFERNPYYWGEKPKSETVEVAVIADPNARALAFESGMINIIYGLEGQISPDTFERFTLQKNLHTSLSDPISTRLIAMNSARNATQEKAVRVAINHALDRAAISKGIFYGTETPADTLFAKNVPYADIDLKPYQYDPQLAATILEQAGWQVQDNGYRAKSGKSLTVELVYHGHDANQKAIAEVLQANLKKIGVELKLVAEERSRFYKRQKGGEFDLIFNNTWGAPYDPHTFMSGMRRPSHADYMAQAGLPTKAEIDKTIDAILVSTNEEKRHALYKKVLTTLHEEAVYLPVTYLRITGVSSEKLGKVTMGATVFDIPFEQMGK
ncbi:nickel ABC transporter substrate-binding protein [Vibrio sonorensis]|uniref:nickel ABC transporter substrate-binding protein n=1 Tax=Vibrio sonorensis TaxID=1004316 RepID=UPI0008DA9F90|nr:nickel ABC transporter substrate-binding protein [Vibrio sonorensis]